MRPVRANRQPAAAAYARPPGGTSYAPFAIGVLHIEGDRIEEIIAFHEPALFSAFRLPAYLDR